MMLNDYVKRALLYIDDRIISACYKLVTGKPRSAIIYFPYGLYQSIVVVIIGSAHTRI